MNRRFVFIALSLARAASVRSLSPVPVPQVVEVALVSHAEVQPCFHEFSVGFRLKQQTGAGEREESPSFLENFWVCVFSSLQMWMIHPLPVRGGLADTAGCARELGELSEGGVAAYNVSSSGCV